MVASPHIGAVVGYGSISIPFLFLKHTKPYTLADEFGSCGNATTLME
jgi:hypothetical protein